MKGEAGNEKEIMKGTSDQTNLIFIGLRIGHAFLSYIMSFFSLSHHTSIISFIQLFID